MPTCHASFRPPRLKTALSLCFATATFSTARARSGGHPMDFPRIEDLSAPVPTTCPFISPPWQSVISSSLEAPGSELLRMVLVGVLWLAEGGSLAWKLRIKALSLQWLSGR